MNAPSPSQRLQQAADYLTVRRVVRTWAIGSLVIGLITILLSLIPPFDLVSAVLGLVLIGSGGFNLLRPRPLGLAIDGATVVLVGVFNVVDSVTGMRAGNSGAAVWLRVGVFQLFWGAQSFWRFARYRHAFDVTPAESDLEQLDESLATLRKARAKESPDVIEFTVSGSRNTRWKGRLGDRDALLTTVVRDEVRVAAREEIEITDRGKVLIGSARKATFTIRGKDMKGTIPAESLERFQQWKTGISMPRPIAA